MAAVGAWYAGATAAQVAAAAAAAVTIAASIQQTVQANKNADAQEEAAENRNQQLVEQTVANYDELSDIERDAQQRALEDSLSVQTDFIRNKGRINVMAAAMGTGGMSIKSQLQDIEREKYSNYDTILQSRQAAQDNIRSQAETMRFQAASGMAVNPVSRPSYAAAALSIGATSLGAYGNYQEVSKEAELLKTNNQQSLSSGG